MQSFRYRSYYFDKDSNFYYLQSRYYDPVTHRFINADGLVSTGTGVFGYNMFAYCENNPLLYADPTGESLWIIIPAIILPLIALSGCSSESDTGPYSGKANCYAYAMKLEYDPKTGEPFQYRPQPGSFAGNKLTKEEVKNVKTIKSTIEKKVTSDVKVLDLTFTEVYSADHVAKPGNWVVALAYSTKAGDYHWYRRDDDGTWSHKPGEDPIMRWDYSFNFITDPATCNRDRYDSFLGYYEVGPN